jgi:hypothetical protein
MLQRASVVFAMLLTSACVPLAPVVVTPTAPRPIAVVTCAPGAAVRLADESVPQITGPDGTTTFAAVNGDVAAINLHIRATGYADYDQVVVLPVGGHELLVGGCRPLTVPGLQLQLPALVVTRAFPPEQGSLHVVDRHFETEDGQPWSWRGSSMFLLGARAFTGQDISPQIAWMEGRGVNVARVFDISGNPDWNLAGYGVADPGETDPVKLGAFFDQLAAQGLRVEYVPLTYSAGVSIDLMRARVQRAYDVAAGRWNVFIEVANEPENNGIDVPLVLQGIDRKGVLSASGMDPGRHCDAEVSDNAAWNACMRREVLVLPGGYLTAHDLARDDQHSPRNTKDFTQDFAGVFRVPIVADEHIGIIDRSYPGYCYGANGFAANCRGGGVRTIDCTVILSAAGIEHIFGPGFTIHLQAGLEGRAPRADEPIQTACAESLTQLWQFIPPIAQLGQYKAPHLGGFPFVWAESDSLVTHAYCSPVGGQAWCVNPMPSTTWPGFVGQNGWRLDAVSPIPFIARMVQ